MSVSTGSQCCSDMKTDSEIKGLSTPAPLSRVMTDYQHATSLKTQPFTPMDTWITHLAKEIIKNKWTLVTVNYPFNRSFARAQLSPLSADLMLCKWIMHIKMVWINTMTIYRDLFQWGNAKIFMNCFFKKENPVLFCYPVAPVLKYDNNPNVQLHLIVCVFPVFDVHRSNDNWRL